MKKTFLKGKKTKRNILVASICMFAAMICLGIFIYSIKAYAVNKSFWIEYIDVGQGDAALIQCDGHYMLIDGGPANASSIIYTLLKDKGINELDYMIATHPDADHIGGLSAALNVASVNKCYSPVDEHETKTFKNLVRYLNNANNKLIIPKEYMDFRLGSARIQIFLPECESDEINNSSIITLIEYGDTSFLFMGDAQSEEEEAFIKNCDVEKIDVLKLGHHGSNSSTSETFLDKYNFKYAVISVGEDNEYNHPTYSVLERLYRNNIDIFRTDLQGDIICVSDGKEISISTEKNVLADMLWISSDGRNVISSNPIKDIDEDLYVLNTRSMKFHKASCKSVNDINNKNRRDVKMSRDDIIKEGYIPCKVCNP